MSTPFQARIVTPKGARLSLPLRDIVEIIDCPNLSAFPGVERPVLGLVSYYGEALTVLDIDFFINPSNSVISEEDSGKYYVLVFNWNGTETGLLIQDIEHLSAHEMPNMAKFDLDSLKVSY